MAAVLLDGVVDGLQLGLLAVGLSLLYGLGGVLNLAHGSLAVTAAIVTSLVAGGVGWPIGVAAAIGVLSAVLIALALDRTVLRPVHREPDRGRAVLLSLLVTLGVALVLDGALEWRYPSGQLGIRIGGGPVDLLGVPMRRGALVAAGISLTATGALVVFLRSTTAGRAVRCVLQDETGARLVGVDPARVRTLVLGLGGGLAGLVAVTSAMTAPVDVRAGFGLTVEALIVAVVGGLGSARGALLAGLLLGVVNAVGARQLGGYATSVLLLVAAATTILVRPRGLLGGAA
jgi:branched-chain amino acid transport system permease protein